MASCLDKHKAPMQKNVRFFQTACILYAGRCGNAIHHSDRCQRGMCSRHEKQLHAFLWQRRYETIPDIFDRKRPFSRLRAVLSVRPGHRRLERTIIEEPLQRRKSLFLRTDSVQTDCKHQIHDTDLHDPYIVDDPVSFRAGSVRMESWISGRTVQI